MKPADLVWAANTRIKQQRCSLKFSIEKVTANITPFTQYHRCVTDMDLNYTFRTV